MELVTLAYPLMASPLLYPLLAGLCSLDGVLPMIPSEAAVLAAGVFAHAGTPSLWLVVVVTALGVLAGDHLAYGLSRSVVGPRLINRSKHLGRAVAAAGRRLDRHADLLIVTSRFLPGGRVTMNAACGTTRLPLSRFSPASALAALLWSAYTAGIGYLGGTAFVENPLLGLAVGLGLSLLFRGIVELTRRWGVHHISMLLAATTALTLLTAAAAAAAVPGEATGVGLQRKLDDVRAAGAVGALAEVRDEHGVWRGTSGVAELSTTRPVPVHGQIRAGSITETFLATVVLQLVGEGRLRLEDPVEAWLPGVVPDGHRITVRHLLNHTSGLYDYRLTLPLPPRPEFLDNRWRTWTPTELIQRAVANPPTFEPPGSAFAYSNTGYLLLGQIVEKVTGRSYRAEIMRRIILPMRLHDTWLPGTSPGIPEPHPHGYAPVQQDGQTHLVDFTEMNPSVMGASGEIISTTRDLNQFFSALLGGHLLPNRLLDEMRTPGVAGGTYGLGLAWRDTACGVRVYGNDGDALAYQSWSYSTPDRRRQVTLALTPNFRGDPDDAVDALLNKAICG
jgi:D-alanyl-D-alanine carboxypeptidase